MTHERHHVLVVQQTIDGNPRKPWLVACSTCGWNEVHLTQHDAFAAREAHDPRCTERTDLHSERVPVTCERMAGHPPPHRFTFEWEE